MPMMLALKVVGIAGVLAAIVAAYAAAAVVVADVRVYI